VTPHKIRPLKAEKKLFIGAGCDLCNKKETLACYESEIEKRDFLKRYYECDSCRQTICSDCAAGMPVCPVCFGNSFTEIRPFDLFYCGVCLREWLDDGGLCKECRYPRLEEIRKLG